MTGKQLKEWAATVPDGAEVEVKTGDYTQGWEPLRASRVRAVMSPVQEPLTPVIV